MKTSLTSRLHHYAPILDRCTPFLIAHAGILPDLNRDPAGVAIPDDHIVDPQHMRHGDFLAMLRLLDQLTFGPFGMEMPPWVFYDCAVMPGAVFGLAIRAAELEPWALEAVRVPPGYQGLVPISQFIAIPMLEGFADAAPDEPPSSWLLYTCESINQVSPGFGPAGALRLTLALGLQVFPIRRLVGTCQWRSEKLSAYADLGPLELLTAYTPGHSLPRTLSYRIDVDETSIAALLTSPRVHPRAPAPNALLDVDDVDALRGLQADLEAGGSAWIVGHPLVDGPRVQVPLHRHPAGTTPDHPPLGVVTGVTR